MNTSAAGRPPTASERSSRANPPASISRSRGWRSGATCGSSMPLARRDRQPRCRQALCRHEHVAGLLEPTSQRALYFGRQCLARSLADQRQRLLFGRLGRDQQRRKRRARHLERSLAELVRDRHVPAGELGLRQQSRCLLDRFGGERRLQRADGFVHQRTLGPAGRLAKGVAEGPIFRRWARATFAREIDASAHQLQGVVARQADPRPLTPSLLELAQHTFARRVDDIDLLEAVQVVERAEPNHTPPSARSPSSHTAREPVGSMSVAHA